MDPFVDSSVDPFAPRYPAPSSGWVGVHAIGLGLLLPVLVLGGPGVTVACVILWVLLSIVAAEAIKAIRARAGRRAAARFAVTPEA